MKNSSTPHFSLPNLVVSMKKPITPNPTDKGFGTSEESQLLFEEDKIWLQKVEDSIHNNLSNNLYTVSELAADVVISERQLRRRLKKLTGLAPAQYLRNKRLQKAHQLISSKKYKTITQVAYAVGLKDIGAFRENFKEMYGDSPLEFLKK